MNKRSKKYFKAAKIDKPTSAESAKITQGNPAKQTTPATQDDTGGGNDSGKRKDEN